MTTSLMVDLYCKMCGRPLPVKVDAGKVELQGGACRHTILRHHPRGGVSCEVYVYCSRCYNSKMGQRTPALCEFCSHWNEANDGVGECNKLELETPVDFFCAAWDQLYFKGR